MRYEHFYLRDAFFGQSLVFEGADNSIQQAKCIATPSFYPPDKDLSGFGITENRTTSVSCYSPRGGARKISGSDRSGYREGGSARITFLFTSRVSTFPVQLVTLIGCESRTSFGNQSHSNVKQNQT